MEPARSARRELEALVRNQLHVMRLAVHAMDWFDNPTDRLELLAVVELNAEQLAQTLAPLRNR